VKHVFSSGQGHSTTGLLVMVVLGMLQVPGHSSVCFSSIFRAAAPVIALQVTWFVTSVKIPLQAVIFCPCSKKAITFLPSRIKNCLLIFFPFALFPPFTTNLSPLLQPFADFVSSWHRSMYSQCFPFSTFLDCSLPIDFSSFVLPVSLFILFVFIFSSWDFFPLRAFFL